MNEEEESDPGSLTFSPAEHKVPANAETVFANGIRDGLSTFKVTDDKSSAFAVEVCRDVKAHIARIDEQRKTITAPLRAAEKATNDFFRPALTTLRSIESDLKAKIACYESSQRALAASTMQAIAKGADLVAVPLPERPKGTGIRPVTKWEVINEHFVPREFCSPDPAKIEHRLKFGVQSIPGIKIWTEDQVTIRKDSGK